MNFIASSANYQQLGYDGRVVKPDSGIDKSFTSGDLLRIRSHIRVVARKLFVSFSIPFTDHANLMTRSRRGKRCDVFWHYRA